MLTEALGDADLARRVFDLHWVKRRELAETELEAKPGAVGAVHELKREGYRLAVASSSSREMIELNLSRAGMLDAFDIITGGTEVENGKPHRISSCSPLKSWVPSRLVAPWWRTRPTGCAPAPRLV